MMSETAKRNQPLVHLKAGLQRLARELEPQSIEPQLSLLAGLTNLVNGFSMLSQHEVRDKASQLEQSLLLLVSEIDLAKNQGKWIKSHFNSFDVLGFPHNRLERIHSNILAWLLDPTESHRFAYQFLQRLVGLKSRLRVRENETVSVWVEPQDRGDRPDIIVEGERWRVIIENKVDSLEGKEQTARYVARYIGKKDKVAYFIWIAPSHSRKPEDSTFQTVTYLEIADILKDLANSADENVSAFLCDIIEHIERDIA